MKLTSYFCAILCFSFFGSIKGAEQTPITPTNASSNQDSGNLTEQSQKEELEKRVLLALKNEKELLEQLANLVTSPTNKARLQEISAKYHVRAFSI